MEIPLASLTIQNASTFYDDSCRIPNLRIWQLRDPTFALRREVQNRLKLRTDDMKLLRKLNALMGEGNPSSSDLKIVLVKRDEGKGKRGRPVEQVSYHLSLTPTGTPSIEKPNLLKMLRDKFGEKFGLKATMYYPAPTKGFYYFSAKKCGIEPDVDGNIHAELTYDKLMMTRPEPLQQQPGLVRLQLCFRRGPSKRKLVEQCEVNQKMLKTEMGTDAVIVSGNGKEFKCHKVFLYAHSPVLQAMLLSGMEESRTSRIQVPDLSEEVVEAFLQYLYTKDTSKVAGDCEVCFGLLYAAHKYEVKCLEEHAVELLEDLKNEDYRVDIALKLFVFLGNIPESEELKKKSAAVMKQNFYVLAALPEYDDLFKKNPEGAKELTKYLADA